jgi:hypothetical protein
VQTEERRGEDATDRMARVEPPEQQQREQRVGRVQKNVDQVRPCRAGAEKLDVEHVGEPGERMPVRRLPRGEGPDEAVAGQPREHLGLRVT